MEGEVNAWLGNADLVCKMKIAPHNDNYCALTRQRVRVWAALPQTLPKGSVLAVGRSRLPERGQR